jgi:two-component system, chemotaxis family, CheB/CheR fusion protein
VTESPDQFPIVGIGASAGGLAALEQLFQNTPPDTGAAFVVVTHQASGHETALPEILGRTTSMHVELARDSAQIKPNHIYVTQGGEVARVVGNRFRLTASSTSGLANPIDIFLSSLAGEVGELAAGVVLSGAGSDGALGLKAIKAAGGVTFAQTSDAHGPGHSSMPDTAIALGIVDFAVPAEQMGHHLVQFGRGDGLGAQLLRSDGPADDASLHESIHRILLRQVGHDFSGYKQKTLLRRVGRRMHAKQIDSLAAYVDLLESNAEEVTLLFRDLLIGVTNFFRDPDAFEALEQSVIPKLFQGKSPADTVRIWVPGCASGEEVYSIAILVREHLDTLSGPPKVQIFATDIDERALAVARTGRYPRPLLEQVAPERLKRFFTGDEVSSAVIKGVRDMCIFSSHSVIRDPPFSRIDMISCRNLLIYLGAEFQRQVIPVFHFALRAGGYLFLGTSENVSQHSDLFTSIEKRQRIFQRRDNVHLPLQLPMLTSARRSALHIDSHREHGEMSVNLRRQVESRIMDRFAPAHVVVNSEGDILHYSSRTGKYLEPAVGLPNRQLLAMARRGLRLDLRGALREAVENRHASIRERVSVDLEDRVQLVNIAVEPFGEHDRDPLFLVVFTDVGMPTDRSVPIAGPVEKEHSHERLELELRDTRERLQGTIEEYETAVEELKSSNEELQSINEELQSTNEELETSKEELQSVNEELHTVNAELNSKVDEVDRSNSDLRNLFESTQVATVFLDRHLIVRSFTPAVTSIFNLIQSDRGRPLTDIVSHVEQGDLQRDVSQVLETGQPLERNVHRFDGAGHYLMRVLPYRGQQMHIEGALVTYFDVTRVIAAEEHQRTLVEELNHRVRNMLTIVNAIASQTLARSTSVETFKEAFTGRIRAMGTAYSLVSHEGWGDVDLLELVKRHIEPYGTARVHISGPQMLLRPNAALAFGMVIHELSTNAVKYGALAHAQGRLDVSWTAEIAEHSMLRFNWREITNAPVEEPTRRGFGTELIERELKHVLEAQTRFDYKPGGLEISMQIPIRPDRVRLGSAGVGR